MSKFGDAFAAARKAGKQTFTWNGKKFHTKTKEEMGGGDPKSTSGPKARPKTTQTAPKKRPASIPSPMTPPRVKEPATSPMVPPRADAKPKRKAAGTPDASGRRTTKMTDKPLFSRVNDKVKKMLGKK